MYALMVYGPLAWIKLVDACLLCCNDKRIGMRVTEDQLRRRKWCTWNRHGCQDSQKRQLLIQT